MTVVWLSVETTTWRRFGGDNVWEVRSHGNVPCLLHHLRLWLQRVQHQRWTFGASLHA